MANKLQQLKKSIKQRILFLDGAMGTMIQSYKLAETDYRGTRFFDHAVDLAGNHDLLSITQPDIIREIHTAYLEAGADIIETNTFNANAISMADYQMQGLVYEINRASAMLACAAINEFKKKNGITEVCRWGTRPNQPDLLNIT